MNESLQFTITEPYQWIDFEESAFNISLTGSNVNNLSFLRSTKENLPFVIGFNELNIFSLQPCSRYLLQITAVSPIFGVSQPAELEFVFPNEGH